MLHQDIKKSWKIGMNFGRARYHLIDQRSFVPYVWTDGSVAVPMEILENMGGSKNGVAILKLYTPDGPKVIVRPLVLNEHSAAVYVNAKQNRINRVEVVKVIPIAFALRRSRATITGNRVSTTAILPRYTRQTLDGHDASIGNPLYALQYKEDILTFCHGGLDHSFKMEINIDQQALEAIGLYQCERENPRASAVG